MSTNELKTRYNLGLEYRKFLTDFINDIEVNHRTFPETHSGFSTFSLKDLLLHIRGTLPFKDYTDPVLNSISFTLNKREGSLCNIWINGCFRLQPNSVEFELKPNFVIKIYDDDSFSITETSLLDEYYRKEIDIGPDVPLKFSELTDEDITLIFMSL